MSKKAIIQLVVSLCSIVIFVLWTNTLMQRRRMIWNDWDVQARATFREALQEEVDKRKDITFPFYVNIPNKEWYNPLGDSISDYGYVESEEGRKEFHVTERQRANSLIKSRINAIYVGGSLGYCPIHMDTLNVLWDNKLKTGHVVARTQCRYSAPCETNFFKDSLAYSRDTLQTISLDSLTSLYIGGYCEKEYTAYIAFSHWSMFGWMDFAIYFLILLCWSMILFRYDVVEAVLSKSLVRLGVAKEVLTYVPQPVKGVVYDLGDGIYYNSQKRTILMAGQTLQLSPQQNVLFRGFMRKDDRVLTTEEIYRELWNGKGTPDTLYSTIRHLREALSGIPSIEIVNQKDSYVLIIPSDKKRN